MEFLAGALVIIALLFSFRPPTLIFRKVMVVEQPTMTKVPGGSEEKEDLSKLNEDLPPSLDDVMRALNETLHELEGGGTRNE